MCAQWRLKSACAFAQSDQSLRCPHDETLHPWLSKMRKGKILSEVIYSEYDFAQNLWLRSEYVSTQNFHWAKWYTNVLHYENMPIQIYRKFHLQKMKIFRKKNSDIFHISAQNIDCGYPLEPPLRGGSNEYPQSMFLSRNKKNNVYPCKSQFYCIKMEFKGVKIIKTCFRDVYMFYKLRNRNNFNKVASGKCMCSL